MGQLSFPKIIFVCFLLAVQSIQAQVTEPHKDIRKPVDSASGKSVAGDKPLANGQLLSPAGQSLSLTKGARVLNLEFVHQQQILIAKTKRQLALIYAKDFKPLSSFDYPDKESGSMNGLTVGDNDSTIYFTGLQKNLYVGNVSRTGTFTLTKKIDLSNNNKKTNPLGIGLCKNNIAFVALAITNEIAVVDLSKGKLLNKIPVGVCPYAVIISKDKKLAFVSNFGGPHPGKKDRTEKSAGTDVAVDERSVALRGSVTVIDIQSGKRLQKLLRASTPNQ